MCRHVTRRRRGSAASLRSPATHPETPDRTPHDRDPTPQAPVAANDPTDQAPEGSQLRRTMESRHLVMIALGGVIGSGLFVSS